MKKLFFLTAFITITLPLITLNAQNSAKGTVSGKIIDAETGEIMRRATVMVKDTKLGAYSDVLGTFKIKNVPEGTYSLRISFVGYVTKEIQGVKIAADKTTDIGTVTLQVEKKTTDEVEVVAERINDNQAAMLAVRKNAAQVSDGISAEEIKKTPDSDAGQSLRRVSGVTLVGDKYVYVRGVSERYSNTTLNGTSLSSTEPDKKAFAFDMFPAEFLQNANVAKTFTPDLPGNFAGGLVQLNTVDYPTGFAINFGASASMSDNITFKSNAFTTYSGGSSDWLGYDDGLRAMPTDLPNSPQAFRDFIANDLNNSPNSVHYEAQQRYSDMIKSFNYSTFNKEQTTAPFNGGLSLSYSDIYNVGGNDLGLIASMIYGNEYTSDAMTRRVRLATEDTVAKYSGAGSSYTNSTNMGFIANLAYKIGTSTSITLKNTYSNQSTNEVIALDGYKEANLIYQMSYQFVQTSLYSTQLGAQHDLSFLNSVLDWKIGYSKSTRDEPDLKRMRFSRNDTSSSFFADALNATTGSGSQAGRFYSNLNENAYNALLNYKIPFEELNIKVGGLYETKSRDFVVRSFVIAPGNFVMSRYITVNDNGDTLSKKNTVSDSVYSAFDFGKDVNKINPSSLFNAENFGIHGLSYLEETEDDDSYSATEDLAAAYIMGDFNIPLGDQKLRVIAGVRLENANQKLNTYYPIKTDSTFDIQNIVDANYLDYLPSINFVYSATKDMNIRVSASQTLTRPSLREYAPFSFYDFKYQMIVKGNPGLKEAIIQNYDLRWEWFPNPGEVLSVSLFYKNFHDAIEQTLVPTSSESELTYSNALGDAKNYGVEFETRKNLSFLAGFLKEFSFNFNLSLINSRISVSQAGIEDTRSMWGQSPYSVNFGLYYFKPDWGTSVNLAYNTYGKRIIQVADLRSYKFPDPHVYELPRNVIDLSIAQNITDNFSIKFVTKDLLNEKLIWEQGGQQVSTDLWGSKYSLSFSYNFK